LKLNIQKKIIEQHIVEIKQEKEIDINEEYDSCKEELINIQMELQEVESNMIQNKKKMEDYNLLIKEKENELEKLRIKIKIEDRRKICIKTMTEYVNPIIKKICENNETIDKIFNSDIDETIDQNYYDCNFELLKIKLIEACEHKIGYAMKRGEIN